MLDDTRLHLVLYDVKEGRSSRCKLASNDERKVVRDVICAMVFADLNVPLDGERKLEAVGSTHSALRSVHGVLP